MADAKIAFDLDIPIPSGERGARQGQSGSGNACAGEAQGRGESGLTWPNSASSPAIVATCCVCCHRAAFTAS